MFSKTVFTLAAASVALGVAVIPAAANYDRCYENPAAAGCPGNYDLNNQRSNRAAHSYQGASHHTPRHHG
jgi:hypothetical protein